MNTLPSEQIKKLNLVFPPAPKPAGVYRPVLVVGNFLYVSGQGPMKNDGTLMLGRLGDNLTTEEGKLVARQVGLTMLSSIKRILEVSIKLNGSLRFWGWSTVPQISHNTHLSSTASVN